MKHVQPGSAAARAGLSKSAEIVTMQGQDVLSQADVQWILHQSGETARIPIVVRRDGQNRTLEMKLDTGWRSPTDLSWRVTTWDLRRMGTGGLLLENLPEQQRRKAGLQPGQLGLLVKHVGQYGAHAVAKRAGFKKGDIVVSFDGRNDAMTESLLLGHAMQRTRRGEVIPVSVLRNGRRLKFQLKMQ